MNIQDVLAGLKKIGAQTYTGFSGCDMLLHHDEKIVGEVQAITFESVETAADEHFSMKTATTHPIAVKLICNMSDKSKRIKDGSVITIVYAEDKQYWQTIYGVKQIWPMADCDLDGSIMIKCIARRMEESPSVRDKRR
jgi:hypothetical protein